MEELRRRRLGQLVLSARTAKGYRGRKAFAEAAGLSSRVIDKVETGDRVSPATLHAVERVLGWRTGTAQAVIDTGKDPETETGQAQAHDPGTLAWFIELRRSLPEDKFFEVVDQMTRGKADDSPSGGNPQRSTGAVSNGADETS